MAWERTNYQRGADFERKVRDHLLHDLEARLVVRSAGSHGPVDLVAFFDPTYEPVATNTAHLIDVPTVWLVQVKKDGVLPETEREALLQVAAETGCRPMLAWHVPRHGVRLTEVGE